MLQAWGWGEAHLVIGPSGHSALPHAAAAGADTGWGSRQRASVKHPLGLECIRSRSGQHLVPRLFGCLPADPAEFSNT